MKKYTVFQLALTLIFAVLPLTAEVLSPPPLPPNLGSARSQTPNEPLIGSSWIVLKRFTDSSGSRRPPENTSHNYTYDLGAHVVFWNPKPFSLEGMVRMIITSEHPNWDSNTWLLNLSSVIIEQNLMARLSLGGGSVELGFHHNSKHDLDRAMRRVPIHDSLRLTGFAPPLMGSWGTSPLGWRINSDLRLEYVIPPVFQSDVPEPYRGGVFANLDSDILILPNRMSLFVQGRIAVIANELNNQGSWDLDWQIRSGLRLPTKTGGLGAFVEVQRLNDDWISQASKAPNRTTDPWNLVGFGIMFWQ